VHFPNIMFTCVMHVLQVYSLCVCVCVYASVRVCAHSNTDRRKSSRRKIRCSAVSLQLQPPSPNQPSLYATPSQAVSFGGKTAGTLHGGDCANWPRRCCLWHSRERRVLSAGSCNGNTHRRCTMHKRAGRMGAKKKRGEKRDEEASTPHFNRGLCLGWYAFVDTENRSLLWQESHLE